MGPSRRSALLGLALVTILLGTACSPNQPLVEPVSRFSSLAGAVEADLPATWGPVYAYRKARPSGEGFVLRSAPGAPARMAVYASATAVATTLGDDPRRTDLYSFRQVLSVQRAALPHLIGHSDCGRFWQRPLQVGPLYGEQQHLTDCEEGESVSRILLLHQDRGYSVLIEAKGPVETEVADTAQRVARGLTIDEHALPLTVAEDVFVLLTT